MSIKNLTSFSVVDSHVHVFPPKLFQAIRQWFETFAWRFQYDGQAEDFIETYFGLGLSGMVLLPFAHKPGMSGALNDFVADLTRRYPGTVGLAAVHPRDDHVPDLLKRAFEEQGLAGVKLHCHVLGLAPDDDCMWPIYETALEYDRRIVIHAGKEPATEGYGLDVRTVTGADRVEKVLQRYPDLKMIVPHLGVDEPERFLSLLERYPGLYLDTAMVVGRFFPVETRREWLIQHQDRILYGTDYPHIPYPVDMELRALLEMNLDQTTLGKVLGENARKVWAF